jgi:hypothetical protein
MFAIFLLALLADVAWSQVPAVAGSDSTGLILTAAGPLRDGSSWDDAIDLRRANRVFAPRPGFRSYRRTYAAPVKSVWAHVLSGDAWRFHSPDSVTRASQSVPLLLADAELERGPSASCWRLLHENSDAPSIGVYEHSGTPAP